MRDSAGAALGVSATPAEIFVERSRYYLSNEYLPKLRQCVAPLSDEDIWRRANDSSNSIGNLLLHLTGNIRQWIVEGIGNRPVKRDRPAEFSARSGGGSAELMKNLEAAVAECDAVLSSLTAEDLVRCCTIQGRETTVIAAVYHVIEHFAMHTGQIVLLTKVYAPGAIHFYDDSGWTARPLWGGSEGIR